MERKVEGGSRERGRVEGGEREEDRESRERDAGR
jgi:hypothetical protein